jgi:hypothetical protein
MMKGAAVATEWMVLLPPSSSDLFTRFPRQDCRYNRTHPRCPVSRIQYDIVPIAGGWQVNCNGTVGTPYSGMSDAVQDTLATANQLRKHGDKVEVRLLQLDGTRRVLEARDARLYPRS